MNARLAHPVHVSDALRRIFLLAASLVIALGVLAVAGPWFAFPLLLAGVVTACVWPFKPSPFAPSKHGAPVK